jgi:hypothetical protein
MSNFPLLTRAGLSMAPLYTLHEAGSSTVERGPLCVLATDLELWLERAPLVHTWEDCRGTNASTMKGPYADHTARLVLIEPVVRDSEERKLLREYVRRAGDCHAPMWESIEDKQRFVERVRKLLEGK